MPHKEILAIIPARGGSKGIPRKNVRMFGGKPLIAHTIDAAKEAPSVNRIIVSTDDAEIARVSKECGAEVPFLRPRELATSASKVVDAVIHLLEKLKADEAYEPTYILLLQPTSPLRTSEDVERAVKLFFDAEADSLVSVCRTENVLMTKDAEDVLTVQNPELLSSPNRQELPAFYKFDGSMIYLTKTEILLKEHSFIAGKLVGYEIPRWRGADMDELQDFVVGELIFKNKDEIERAIQDFL
ncbi:MAG: acylneuraminate cytidylyltransferase family protein [bacterium]|nr:acylneuraminate cytidylyltransferase family protein [bacterium]